MNLDDPRDKMLQSYEQWVEKHSLEFTNESFELFNYQLEVQKLSDGIAERLQEMKDATSDACRGWGSFTPGGLRRAEPGDGWAENPSRFSPGLTGIREGL